MNSIKGNSYDYIIIDDIGEDTAKEKWYIDEIQTMGMLEQMHPIRYPQETEDIENESKFARRTQGTKKPLPFYHGNKRRF